MCSFYFSLALALAIAFTCFGSSRAAPAFANNTSCQTECKYGEYCDEKSSSCTACLDCQTLHRIPADGCAKTGSDCVEDCLDGFEQIGNECRQSSTVGNDTETGTTDGVTPGQKDGIKNEGDKGTEITKDTIRPPGGHPAASPWGNFTTIVVAIGFLAGIVVAVACVIRRSCSSNQGGGGWPPKRPRREEEGSAHFHRAVPEESELDEAGTDEDAELYDQNIHQPVSSQDEEPDVLGPLLADELNNLNAAAAAVEAQQPSDPNGLLDEVSVPLLTSGPPALLPNDIRPEMENANEVAVGNSVNEPPAPEQEQVDHNVIRVLSDFVQLRNNNNEDRGGNVNISGGDSGIGDDDRDDPAEHEVPRSPPSSPDSQLPDESVQDNPIANVSNNNPGMLEIALENDDQPKVAIQGRSVGETARENRI